MGGELGARSGEREGARRRTVVLPEDFRFKGRSKVPGMISIDIKGGKETCHGPARSSRITEREALRNLCADNEKFSSFWQVDESREGEKCSP